VVVGGVGGAVSSVVGGEPEDVEALPEEVAVTTGGGISDVDGRRPAAGGEDGVPGRSVKVGMASGGAAVAGELAVGVVVEFGWLAAGVGWTVVYCVSVTTTSRDPSPVVRMPVEVGVAADVGVGGACAEVGVSAEVGGMAIGAAVLVPTVSVAFDC
jgi:hypothetical protein